MKNISRNSRTSYKKLIREALYNIVRLEANINYTLFVMQTSKNKIMSYTLGIYGL